MAGQGKGRQRTAAGQQKTAAAAAKKQNASTPHKNITSTPHKNSTKPSASNFTSSSDMITRVWAPGPYTAFKALLSARLCAAIFGVIADCDETFNYWEPSHYLVYGSGFQTWEYSPQFALRSYFYLMLHAAPAWLYDAIITNKRPMVLFFVRLLLGLLCSACDLYFYRGIVSVYGGRIGRVALCLLVFSAGMFASATAFLPSSFAMYAVSCGVGAWLFRKYQLTILCFAVASLLGWPFVALVGAPIAYDIIMRKRNVLLFFKWSVISALVIMMLSRWVCGGRSPSTPVWLALSPLYLWLVVFVIQPHKEERFLFPVYPLICLAAAIAIDSIEKIVIRFPLRAVGHKAWCLPIMILLVTSGISISRIVAQYAGYSTPLHLFMELQELERTQDNESGVKTRVCLGKEWHRYPSSFFLPDDSWEVQFLQSQFKGQLPQHYLASPEAASLVRDNFNDLNKEETDRYVKLETCHYLVDRESPDAGGLEPQYSRQTNVWKAIKTLSFLDASRSPRLFRAFYIPYYTERYCVYNNYSLLQNILTVKTDH